MTERTEPVDMDALLARILTEPTRAARLLTETAARLEADHPFLVLPRVELNRIARDVARDVLAGLPPVVVDEANQRARAVCPQLRDHEGETKGEYALRLRDAARGL
ncbi:hypothetical protein [Streptomyces sp. NPDC019507]|uniref:hypothetical protein n=1 Tax=Streptomyces sp. NPDC019507 TaxID=3154689 RepID=UPI0033F37C42